MSEVFTLEFTLRHVLSLGIGVILGLNIWTVIRPLRLYPHRDDDIWFVEISTILSTFEASSNFRRVFIDREHFTRQGACRKADAWMAKAKLKAAFVYLPLTIVASVLTRLLLK